MPRLIVVTAAWMVIVTTGCHASDRAPSVTPIGGRDELAQEVVYAQWMEVYTNHCESALREFEASGKRFTPDIERSWLEQEAQLLESFAAQHDLAPADLRAIIAAVEQRRAEVQHATRRGDWRRKIGFLVSLAVLGALNLPLFMWWFPHSWQSMAEFLEVVQTALSFAPQSNWYTRQLNLHEGFEHVHAARFELLAFFASLGITVLAEYFLLRFLLAWFVR